MIRYAIFLFIILGLAGCYKNTPTDTEAIDIAKKEVAMALCGKKEINCITTDAGKANIGPRLKDHTNKITVTFKSIKLNDQSKVDGKIAAVDAGIVSYEFDSKTGDTYIKQISLWSDDGKGSVELCGHGYKFCNK